MINAQCPFVDCDDAAANLLGLEVSVLRPIHIDHAVERGAQVGVLAAERSLGNGKCAPQERFGLDVATLRLEYVGQPVEGGGDIEVVATTRRLDDGYCLPKQGLSFGEAALGIVEQTQAVQGVAHIWM